ncbi:MAG: hypothetical protein OEX83_04750 [Gammaproteobacteria bacterium]|nr:hypothetical protein [Gammaproteobacteria bacterium]
MKKIIYFSLVFVLYAVYAEDAVMPDQLAEIPLSTETQPADAVVEIPTVTEPVITLDTLLQSTSLFESMQELVHEHDKQLQIQFLKNTKNTQLVMELQDKLVAFGLPSERIRLLPVDDQSEAFLFEVIEQTPYQEQIPEPEIKSGQEQE